MTATTNVWTETFRVRSYEINPRGEVSIRTLCSYLQEAAANHAQALGVSVERLEPEGKAWVLTRLHIKIDDYPEWQEQITVETWPSGQDGLYATREFLLRDDKDKVFAWASSAWLILDMESKRPIRIPDYVKNIALPDRERSIDDMFVKLQPPAHPRHERHFNVRYCDLDINQHVNNVCYAEWILESVPEKILRHYRLTELQLQFRAETTYGETIRADTQQMQQGAEAIFDHALVSEESDITVALARTCWISD